MMPLPHGDGPVKGLENWVQCDRCEKWRRVREDIVSALDDDTKWFCEDNPDTNHNSCHIPQEMTNEEIDRGRAMETLVHERMKRRSRPAIWQLLRDNIYTHRKPKKLYEDDIMVCQCKPASAGGISCRHEDCLNGMLNIECISGFCACGKECKNQRFQRKQYSKFTVERAGMKGFGLYAAEDIKKGAFIVEYVGEILDEEEYLRRKEYYFSVGQRHYYFMNIGNGEVVDACRKGNRARFINHSCEPNCETQKWMIKGELKIGFFATRDIPKGAEIQFDYNFERYGDKPTKCHCGAPSCRGFIGGSSDRYAGVAVDDAGLLGLDMQPIMVSATDVKDAELLAEFDMVMDQAVGIGLNNSHTQALDACLHSIAAQQGSSWGEEQQTGSEGIHWGLGGPLHESLLPPTNTVKPRKLHNLPDTLKCPTVPFSQLPPVDSRLAFPLNPLLGDNAQSDAHTAHDESVSGQTRLSESDVADVNNLSHAAPSEEEDWLDSRHRYKDVPRSPPQPPPSAKRKRTRRTSEVRKRALTAALTSFSVKPDDSQPQLTSSSVKQSNEESKPARDSAVDAAAKVHDPAYRSEDSHMQEVGAEDNDTELLHRGVSEKAEKLSSELKAVPSSADVIGEPRAEKSEPVERNEFNRTDNSEITAPVPDTPPSKAAEKLDSVLEPASKRKRRFVKTVPAKPAQALESAQDPTAPSVGLGKRPAGMPMRGTAGTRAGASHATSTTVRRVSEVERRLETMTGAVHRVLRTECVKDFVRLFNMCDISPPSMDDDPRYPSDDSSEIRRSRRHHNMQTEGQLTFRQRARIADLNLLLDRILDSCGHTIKKEMLRSGLLSRLQFCAINNYGTGYTQPLRKICRTVEELPVTSADVHARRSAQGSFAGVLRALTTHGDREVRKRAASLLELYPCPQAEREPDRVERALALQAGSHERRNGGKGGHPVQPRPNDGTRRNNVRAGTTNTPPPLRKPPPAPVQQPVPVAPPLPTEQIQPEEHCPADASGVPKTPYNHAHRMYHNAVTGADNKDRIPENEAPPPQPPAVILRSDVITGKKAAMQRLDKLVEGSCSQFMLGVPTSLEQALHMNVYDGMKNFIRRHHSRKEATR